jgi:hypothetical protein
VAKGKYEYWLSPDGLTLLEAWARDGLTDAQIAHNMGIRRETLIQWKKLYNNISNALKKGKEVVDIAVENSLFKRAMGYKYDEVTKEPRLDPDSGEVVMVATKIVTKEVQPDVTAQIFWLKNRKPAQWREKQPDQHTSDDNEDDNLYNAIEEAVKNK